MEPGLWKYVVITWRTATLQKQRSEIWFLSSRTSLNPLTPKTPMEQGMLCTSGNNLPSKLRRRSRSHSHSHTRTTCNLRLNLTNCKQPMVPKLDKTTTLTELSLTTRSSQTLAKCRWLKSRRKRPLLGLKLTSNSGCSNKRRISRLTSNTTNSTTNITTSNSLELNRLVSLHNSLAIRELSTLASLEAQTSETRLPWTGINEWSAIKHQWRRSKAA